MTALAQRLKDKYFRQNHPYRVFEREVERYLRPEHTLLDAGCGRTAPILATYRNKASRLIGVDLVDFVPSDQGLELYQCDLGAMPVADGCVDVTTARSVMEHVIDPAPVYGEIYRVLRPGGRFIFLTANLWDYASIISEADPQSVSSMGCVQDRGREQRDVFPIAYRTNTRRAVRKWAEQTGYEIVSFRHLGQYLSYSMFNGFLFLLATGYEKLIVRVSALKFLQGWIFVTLRKPECGRNHA